MYGSVYDSTMGEPLANASVFLWETPSRTETDAEGAYRLQGIPPGDYSLLFSHTRLGEVGASVGPCPISIMPGDGLRVAMGDTVDVHHGGIRVPHRTIRSGGRAPSPAGSPIARRVWACPEPK